MSEIELSVLMGQCLKRRISSMDQIASEAEAWQSRRNSQDARVNWHFTADDAKVRLKQLYPTIEI